MASRLPTISDRKKDSGRRSAVKQLSCLQNQVLRFLSCKNVHLFASMFFSSELKPLLKENNKNKQNKTEQHNMSQHTKKLNTTKNKTKNIQGCLNHKVNHCLWFSDPLMSFQAQRLTAMVAGRKSPNSFGWNQAIALAFAQIFFG